MNHRIPDDEPQRKTTTTLQEALKLSLEPGNAAPEPPDELDLQDPDPEPSATPGARQGAAKGQQLAGVPEWVIVPVGVRFPKGKWVYFMQFRSAWTDRPNDGDRQCILWGLTYNDEKLALARTRDEQMRVLDELTIGMVRSIDGERVDMTTAAGKMALLDWWEAIGSQCRSLLKAHYNKTHSMSDAQKADFFVNCVAETVFG